MSVRYDAGHDAVGSHSKLRYHLVPVRGITQDCCTDPAAARAGKQARHRIIADGVQPPLNQRAYLPDDFGVDDKIKPLPHCSHQTQLLAC
jgi:hypothetical protein